MASSQSGIPDIGALDAEADKVLVVAPSELDHVILLTKPRLLEEADQLVGDGDDPHLFPFGLLERIAALRLDGGTGNRDLFPVEVDVGPTEGRRLAGTHAGIGDQVDRCTITIRHRLIRRLEVTSQLIRRERLVFFQALRQFLDGSHRVVTFIIAQTARPGEEADIDAPANVDGVRL